MLSKVLAAHSFLLTLSIKPSLVESSVSSYSMFKQDVPAGGVRLLLGFAEDLITPQWQYWLAQVLILSTVVPQVPFGLPFLWHDWC